MKTSLWKLILVFSAILVGAALMVPKSFRDKAGQGAVPISSAAQSDANIEIVQSAILVFSGATDALPDVVEYFTSDFHESIRDGRGQIFHVPTLKEAQDLALALNAGTTPPKQRVVD